MLFLLYFYGFATYSFQMAYLEFAIEHRALYAVLFFTAAAVAAPSAVRFDAGEPVIQTLDLS